MVMFVQENESGNDELECNDFPGVFNDGRKCDSTCDVAIGGRDTARADLQHDPARRREPLRFDQEGFTLVRLARRQLWL
ncbi:uncharacterized protein HKW66_Vig0047680 [Vigna angularis]|uniref:Uncharacterized protein n=1 Tax=Phaseolus angularis TaxID=3914 RepID=A0A8T0L5C1_PHAAN|nr:uncharacterized protein HKW66_Vig0047680 [Vigna angularis]